MTTRITIITAAAVVALTLASGAALAQGATAPSTGQGTTTSAPATRGPQPSVPHHKVTPSRYMKHPRPVPEPQTIDALNEMSLEAARKGINFVPPPPGSEHEQAGGGTAKP